MTTAQPFRINHAPRHGRLRSIATTVGVMLGAIIFAIFLNTFVFQSYYVDGESMAPTLHTNDRLIISKVERSITLVTHEAYVPERGQIIVIDGAASPETASSAPELIKRVVGLPGDTVSIANGAVTITTASGESLPFDETYGLSLAPTYSQDDVSIVVPDDSVFVLGDNRARGGSLDSRAFGPVDVDYIDGRLWALIMPFSDLRVF